MKKEAALFVTLFSALLLVSACGGNSTSTGSNSTSTGAGVPRVVTASAPAITSFSPAWQSVGSAITISGTNFDTTAANNSVTFNGTQATVASATSNALVVIVPAGATNGIIKVATAGGYATSSKSFVVQSNGVATPTITSSPASGIIGSTATIIGTNFDPTPGNNIVTFDGTPATVTSAIIPQSAVMATSLLVTVPDATNGNITVTTPGGTAISATTFTLTPTPATTPTITSFTPLNGNAGTAVTINGSHFDPVAANNIVKFNGVTASVTSATATSLAVIVPAGVTSGPITVTTAGVTAKSSTSFSVAGIPVTGLVGGAMQGTALNLLGTALTYAGGGVVNSAANGTGTGARFNNPNGVTTDGTNLYIADSGNRVIRSMNIATGVVTTFAGSGLAGSADGAALAASFSNPVGITTDGPNLYVTDSGINKIRKIVIATGVVSTIAGTGSSGFTDSTTGATANFSGPKGIATDNTYLYVADGNNRIRRIALASPYAVTTLAGSGVYKSQDGTGASVNDATVLPIKTTPSLGTFYSTGSGIGTTNPAPETVASFYKPNGLVITPDKTTLYVTDSGTNVIRKVVIATGVVTTLPGPGFVDATTGASSSFQNPDGMAISADGSTLYVADSSRNRIVQIVLATSQVSVLAGSSIVGAIDATGLLATFHFPHGIVVAGGNLFVTDSGNNLIRQIVVATKAVTTAAGSVVAPGQVNGIGTSSVFNFPYGITTDGTNLYVVEPGANSIRQIVIATGVVTGLAGSLPKSPIYGSVSARASAASFNNPFGVTTDGTNLYVADTGNNTIRQVVIATGDVTTLAGSGVLGSANGVGIAASFNQPVGITTDGTNLYVADSGNNQIRQIVIATGAVTTLAGSSAGGSANGIGAAASFQYPTGITTDGTSLFIADTGNNKIRQIDIATKNVFASIGTGAYWNDDAFSTTSTSWSGSTANFRKPTGITTDGTNLYIADSDNNEIRQIVIATKMVTTLSGSGDFGSLDGTGTAASFSQPVGITTDGKNLYTTEYLNNLIRKIQ